MLDNTFSVTHTVGETPETNTWEKKAHEELRADYVRTDFKTKTTLIRRELAIVPHEAKSSKNFYGQERVDVTVYIGDPVPAPDGTTFGAGLTSVKLSTSMPYGLTGVQKEARLHEALAIFATNVAKRAICFHET